MENVNKNKLLRYMIISMTAFSVVCIYLFANLYIRMNSKSSELISSIGETYMAGVSEQIKRHFNTVVEARISQLKSLTGVITPEEYAQNELEAVDVFQHNAAVHGFKFLAFMSRDGKFERILGDDVSLDDREEFLEALNTGGEIVTVGHNSIGVKWLIVGISADYPMSDGSECTALVGGVPVNNLTSTLSLEEDGEKIYSFIIKKDGSFVIKTRSVVKNNYFDRIVFRYEQKEGMTPEKYIADVKAAIENEEDYSNNFWIGGERRRLYLTKLPHCSWYLVSFMPFGAVNRAIAEFGREWYRSAVSLCASVLCMLFFLFMVFFVSMKNQLSRLEVSKKETADALVLAEQANRSKTVFLNSMSHDIRTPMNAIIGYTNLARSRIEDTDTVVDYLGKIQTASNHLLSLINDVLDMSRIESGKVQITEEKVNLTELMKELKNIINADIRQKNMLLFFDSSDIKNELVMCDKLRLSQVLLNCMSNAIKYTPAGGEVAVGVSQHPVGEDGFAEYSFTVRDNGVGMTQEFVDQIFDPFTRETTTTNSGIQGTGLGMAITKNLLDMMNGDIVVKSEKGMGTEINISIRFRVVEEERTESGAVSDKADHQPAPEGAGEADEEFCKLAGMRVLLVEDNEVNREIAEDYLLDMGVILDIACDGQEAVTLIDAAPAKTYDVVLMDVQMPVMDGYEATKRIRKLKDPDKAGVPIIAMTANAFEEDRRLALDAGMNAHVAKPIDFKRLWDVIADVRGLPSAKNTQAVSE